MAERSSHFKVPDFDDLQKINGRPLGYVGSVFDGKAPRGEERKKDVFGTLNFATQRVIEVAAFELRDGISISLNWSLDAMNKFAIPGRKPAEHTVNHLGKTFGANSWDDELSFNTQSSSQWDSLCHFTHPDTGLTYNGYKPTQESLTNPTDENVPPTLEHWHQRGGLVTRGVLIDYKSYAEEKGITFGPFDGTRITVEDLEACAAHQKVIFRFGDVLIVRTGATEVLEKLKPEDMAGMASEPTISGVHGSVDTARWLWNKRFSAVASDSNSFEAFPPLKDDGSPGGVADLVLHKFCLTLFGMPIGELWDLSRLAKHCKESKRYTFFFTSCPLNHPGLVGSPPNALAIF